jgi:hypothetical protein
MAARAHKLSRTPSPEESGESERPTLSPPFDVEAFARKVGRPTPGGVAAARHPGATAATDRLLEMRARRAFGDHSAALDMAQKILLVDPGNLEAAGCAEECRFMVEQVLIAQLGSLDRVPILLVAPSKVRWMTLDHRAGFVMSLIDGASSIELILDVSGMPRLDALRMLQELVDQGVVEVR